MICIAGNMPIIQVGAYQVTDYDTHWIRQAIQHAAERAEQPHFAFVDEVYDGIVHYLENKCPLQLVTLEALFKRITYTLSKIGFDVIAKAMVVESPPVTISLDKAASEAGDGYELAFYQILKAEMAHLEKLGADEVFFCHMKESILTLLQKEEWSDDCRQLERDILLWFRNCGVKPEQQGHRVRCSLKAVLA